MHESEKCTLYESQLACGLQGQHLGALHAANWQLDEGVERGTRAGGRVQGQAMQLPQLLPLSLKVELFACLSALFFPHTHKYAILA